MIYEIGIHYTGETVYDQQIKLNNIPIDKNQRRFWFNNNIIPHWNEDENSTWVKVPILYNGLNKIYVDDSQIKDLSDIDETMIFGDDFRNETALDTNKWTIISGNVTVNHNFQFTSSSNDLSVGVRSNQLLPTKNNYIAEDMGELTGNYDMDLRIMADANDGIILRPSTYVDSPNYNDNTQINKAIGGTLSLISAFGQYISLNTVYISKIIMSSPTNYTFMITNYNNDLTNSYSTSITDTVLQNDCYITLAGQSIIIYYVFIHKYLSTDPVITYIKPYHRMFHIKNTIFSSEQHITKYNTNSYIETPVIELNGAQTSTINPNNNSIMYYRSSNTQPDITPSGTTTDINNNVHNYWDQNTISNSGWNNTIPSDYITYTSNTVLSDKYIQLKIPLTQQG